MNLTLNCWFTMHPDRLICLAVIYWISNSYSILEEAQALYILYTYTNSWIVVSLITSTHICQKQRANNQRKQHRNIRIFSFLFVFFLLLTSKSTQQICIWFSQLDWQYLGLILSPIKVGGNILPVKHWQKSIDNCNTIINLMVILIYLTLHTQ